MTNRLEKATATKQRNEADLIRKAKNGDERAFTALVRKYDEMVFSFAFKVCRDKDKAAETLQDTFVNVYRKLKQFDGKSKLSTWLYSIVVNNCLMKRRARKGEKALVRLEEQTMRRTERGSDGVSPVDQTVWALKETPLDKVMNRELRDLLDKSILRLPLEYRVVFIMRDVEGLSAEETARVMELSIPAVKSRLRRARLFLREQLNEYVTA